MEYLVAELGVRKALKVMTFMVAWEMVRAQLGRPITLEDYAERLGYSRAKSFRDQALFRDAFPEEFATPEDVLELARAQGVSVQQVRWAS